jgi:hypothetical protein
MAEELEQRIRVAPPGHLEVVVSYSFREWQRTADECLRKKKDYFE